MRYQLFNSDNSEPLGSIDHAQGAVIWQPGDRVALRIDGKEALFRVMAVGPFQQDGDELVAVTRLKMLDVKGNPVPLGTPDSGGIG